MNWGAGMGSPEVIIIGGGPAGMSALLWCHSLHLRGLLLEAAPEPGGQMLKMFHRIPDYPGLPGLTGREMRDRFVEHLQELGLEWRAGCRIESLDLAGRSLVSNGERLEATALVIATGARRRTLGVPGESRLAMRGVSFSATRDHSLYAGREVCVVGGGDSAIENCLILSRVCPKVTLIHRSERFRARQAWLDEAQATPNIHFRLQTDVVSIEGDESVERVVVRNRPSGEMEPLAAGAVFVKIGIAPNTEPFRESLQLDSDGYIVTDQRQRTSIDQVYAIGDVTNPRCLSVATAVGHGAVAIKEIKERLEQG
jgi:thioredoxin reductase (NADPH)